MYKSFAARRLMSAALAILVLSGCGNRETGSNQTVPDLVDYNQHVRPILSTNCYVCHGPDISSREAGLRLDLRDSAIVTLESGETAIIPGNSAQSELIRRISSTDEDERMPPVEMKKVLSPQEVAILSRWIDQGAEWKPHWSLIPPERVEPAGLFSGEMSIDGYIDATLKAEGLRAGDRADKSQLIRRLSFVLTGLPPTPEGVDAFLQDKSPDAYEQLVDRLLASPHFGERWARHWMDIVRYADTKGHEFDFPIVGAWRYRDYLIRAFNADVPYDQFIKEHLAGDLLEEPRLHPDEGFNESILGTAFFALGEGKHSPVDLQIDEAERIDNIIDVASKTFQGLTVACAKCHDHKFDPIPTTDYYAWYGIVKSSRFAIQPANAMPDEINLVADIEALDTSIRERYASHWLKETISESETDQGVPIRKASLEVVLPAQPRPEEISVLGDFRSGHFDGWYVDGLAFGEAPTSGQPEFDEEGRLAALHLPRASSARTASRLIGALRSPTFTINQPYITVRAAGKEAHARVVIDNFQLIRNPIYGGLEKEIDASEMQLYRFDVGMWQGREAYVEFMPGRYDQHDYMKSDSSYIAIEYAVTSDDTLIERMMQWPESRTTLTDAIRAWQEGAATPNDVKLLNQALRQGVLPTDVEGTEALIEKRNEYVASLTKPTVFMGMAEGDGKDQPVFIRGSVQNPSADSVARRALTALDEEQRPFVSTGSGRLEWAEGIADPGNALTARVISNRIWHHVFGRGIVETVDNLGIQGKLPSHPELLDYLALQMIESSWSMKSMIREMVLSEAFQRTTEMSEEARRIDPEGVLLQSYPVRRLEAEAIRDAMLSVSGSFDPTMYGESIPIYLSEFMKGRGRPGASGPLDGSGRRSIYISVRRNFLSPFMLVFDMPIPFTTFGKRNTSNVPAQSLTLLNDPFVIQQAETWAQTMISLKELSVQDKIKEMYAMAFARMPAEWEVDDAVAFLEAQTKVYGLTPEALVFDMRPWRDYGHALFNTKEFIHLL